MNEAFYKSLLEAIDDGVYFVDLERRITYWNKAAERISGYSAKEVVGTSCADNVLRHVNPCGATLCKNQCPLLETMQDGTPRQVEVFLHHKLGHRVPVSIRSAPIHDEAGVIIGAVEIFSNCSEQVDLLSELEQLRNEVLTDPLTGVGNRRYAEITMTNLDRNMRENSVPFGVIFSDIDNFKDINDGWGHDIGDKVIAMAARNQSGALRKLDVACRWGGDEFVTFVPNTTPAKLTSIGERLRMLVERSWLEIDGTVITITSSFGCAVSRPGESADSTLCRADKQLYLSKQQGRNRVSIASEQDPEGDTADCRLLRD